MTGNANVKQAVPFFRANIERSLRYYVYGLGFEMTRKWIVEGKLRFCWLQHGEAALMLQEFPKEGHDSWSPKGKVGGSVDLFSMRRCAGDLPHRHGKGNQASKPFVGNGMWVTSLSDPDGYKIEFESLTDMMEP